MIRTIIVLLLGAPALFAQTPAKGDLLKRAGELEGLIAAGEWAKASEASRTLKDAVTDARNQVLTTNGSELFNSILNWLPVDTETLVVARSVSEK